MAVLAAKDGDDKAFYTPKNTVATGSSLYRENSAYYTDDNLIVRNVKTATLDSLVESKKLRHPDLIKIDVQGAEPDVMAGAETALKHCQALTVEMSLLDYNKDAPLFGEIVAATNKAGLKCVDVCEIHSTVNGIVLQVDLLFVRPPILDKYYSAAGLA